MGIRICYQNIVTSQEKIQKDLQIEGISPFNKIIDIAKQVAREGTEIIWHDVKHSSYMINHAYLEMLNTIWVIEGVIEAEKQGYDAVIIGCGNDPGLKEARQAVDIPVVGPSEAAMLLACTMGYKFGVITILDMVNVCEDNIRKIGLDRRAVFPVRVYHMDDPFGDLSDMLQAPEKINPQFEELCRACIADGAEVIIPACCCLSPAATLAGYKIIPGTGVPVIDITQAAVKFAEMLVDLKRTVGLEKSQQRVYKSVPKELRDQMRALTKR